MTVVADGEGNDLIECPLCGNQHDDNELCTCGYDPKLKEKSKSNYRAIHALTATLDFVVGDKGRDINVEIGKEWGLDSDDVVQFISSADKRFMAKRKSHGVMKEDAMPHNTPKTFSRYLDKDLSFVDFVTGIMKLMKREAYEDRSTLSGGALVFIHYQVDLDESSDGRLLIIMVNKKGVFDFNESLVPKKIPSVNLDALRQAVLIDLTLFKSSYPNNEGDPYLHFITGMSKSGFFKRALGCNPKIDNKRSIEQLHEALDGFSNNISLTTEQRIKVRESVKAFIYVKARSVDKKMTISDVGKVIEKCIPEIQNVAGKFEQYVDINEYTIDQYFEPHYTSSKPFGEIKISDDDDEYEVTCNVNTIGSSNKSDKKIIYDKANSRLIIRLTDSGITEIEKIIKGA
ncbi:TPA: nucleoid-associated protein [Proteus mirabilis]|uniref:nucleoid-associated protein n=1 Tax=Proteus TaxID=583 RepID=UPI000360AE96|nr:MULTISPECIES: nucleoid-associated protein [Proteus]DAQ78779.1 MAG TPA: 37-kD nucleoid-associated bacterial protein [Caudoviricetes sp.]AUU39872.1 hypothetical protein MC73_013110 [Proteus mirabilis]EIT1738425.1 nucleoid-associated protein [Proteus mirabilis]EKV7295784.1 nucleoid-associated protein [Proteus mirabilis]EKW9420708.1 nucleoid-associated protein [Proteus mirabilis]